MTDDRHLLGVFLDFENLALGFRDGHHRFDVKRVLKRLVEKGNIVVKRAYADWKRYSAYTMTLQEAAFELLQIPARRMTGKNSADMRLCVDVLDLCYSKSHIDTFVIVSGDSDFSPLVSKLKENGRKVIGLGVKESTSALLRDNCDEFIYYEDLEKEQTAVRVEIHEGDQKHKEAFTLLLDALTALRRENRDVLWASLVKETMKRKMPSFNEAYFGFKSFSSLLEGAEQRGLVVVSRDPQNNTNVVAAFGDEVAEYKEQERRRREQEEAERRKAEEPGRAAPADRRSDDVDWLGDEAAPAADAAPVKKKKARRGTRRRRAPSGSDPEPQVGDGT